METGVAILGGGGAIGFTPNRFSQPPVVVSSIVRSAQNAPNVRNFRPVYFHIHNITKDSFSYSAKDNRSGDKIHWIAVGN